LNAGFSSPETISLAYYQASLFVEHLIERFGEPGLQKLIVGYKDANDLDAVLPKMLGVDFDGLQASFDAFVQKRYSALSEALRAPGSVPGLSEKASAEVARSAAAAHPGSFAVQLTAGEALLAAGDVEGARTALERAATLVPNAVGAGSPRALLAELEEKQGNPAEAMRHLELLLAQDHTGIEFARKLADLARAANDEKRLRLAAERIIEVDPFDATPHGIHGRLALKAGDVATAVREFRVAIDTGPVDQAGAHSDLAEAYLAGGQLNEAKRQAMAALEIAPRYERAQELLLSVVDRKE
jgi:cellulose synthase operon protein C